MKTTVSKQMGFTLLEVLVAALILGISVLGALALQVNASSDAQTGYARGQAASIALDLAERYRSNPYAQATYIAPISWSGNVPARGTTQCEFDAGEINVGALGCSSDQIADFDIEQIRNNAREWLPNGNVWMGVCPNDVNVLCLRVSWLDSDPETCVAQGVATNCVEMLLYAGVVNN
jgi:type IV pilus assembly protein PilV